MLWPRDKEQKTKILKNNNFTDEVNHYNNLKLFEDEIEDKAKNVRV